MNNRFLSSLGFSLDRNTAAEAFKESELNCVTEQQSRARLSVYQNNIFSSLSQALSDTFPVCSQLVGEEFFKALSIEYISHHLPTDPVLSRYGTDFSDFVAKFPPLLSLPYLGEVAAIEYQLLQLTLSAEQITLSPYELQQRLSDVENIDGTCWKMTTNIHLWKTNFASGSMYWAHQPNPPINLEQIDWQQPEYLVLTKKGLWGHCYQLEKDAFLLLERLHQGKTLEEACQNLSSTSLYQTLASIMLLPIFTNIEE